jgi:hypothetical protein
MQTNMPKCSRCKLYGHKTFDCPYRIDKYSVPVICYLCRQYGRQDNHHPRTCRYCQRCGIRGHNKKLCDRDQYHRVHGPEEQESERKRRIKRRNIIFNVTPLSSNSTEVKIPVVVPKDSSKELVQTTVMSSTRRKRNRRQNLRPNQAPRRRACIDNFRSDLHPVSVPMAIDVEMVVSLDRKQLAAWIAISGLPVTKRRNANWLVYSAKILCNPNEIKTYATKWSGLRAIDLSEGTLERSEVQKRISEILKGRDVVGMGLRGDLKSLGIEIPHRFQKDIGHMIKDDNGNSIKLRDMALGFYGKRIQEYTENDMFQGHDPVIDSRYTIKIYNDLLTGSLPEPANDSYQWLRETVADLKKIYNITK